MIGRVFTAECELCRTKFETDPGECPVCGGASFRAIRETVAAAEAIPVPTKKTLPPRGMRKRAAAAKPHVRKVASPPPPHRTLARGTDGRFLPRKKAAGGVAAARSRAASATGGTATIRIDAESAKARLEAALAELREARRASFAAARRKILAESEVRRIRNEIRRAETAARAAFRGKGSTGGLRSVLKTLGGLFAAVVAAIAAALWK